MAPRLKALIVLLEDLGFDSQYPHDGSQSSLTLVPGDSTLSLLTSEGTRHTRGAHVHTDI